MRRPSGNNTPPEPKGRRPEPADWSPPSIEVDEPSIARVYDYYLGGYHNFAVDRAAAEETLAIFPDARLGAQANRAFLRRAVTSCVESGVTQFLDIGSGIPTAGNVHSIAQKLEPTSRVVYVDIDPIAVRQSRVVLAENDLTAVVSADLRHPDRILNDSEVVDLLDFGAPIALLMCSVLHFIPEDDDPRNLIGYYHDQLARGSLLVLSHGTDDEFPPERAGFFEAYQRLISPVLPRSRKQVVELFGGFELLDPGVQWVTHWRPDASQYPVTHQAYGGMGRKN